MKRLKFLTVLILCFTLFLSSIPATFAKSTTLKEQLLQTPLYYKNIVTEGETLVTNKPSVEEQSKFIALTEE